MSPRPGIYTDGEGDRFQLKRVDAEGGWEGCWTDLVGHDVTLAREVVEALFGPGMAKAPEPPQEPATWRPMKVRITYTVEVSEDVRRGINAWYGRPGLATRSEVKDWYLVNGTSMDQDLILEASGYDTRAQEPRDEA